MSAAEDLDLRTELHRMVELLAYLREEQRRDRELLRLALRELRAARTSVPELVDEPLEESDVTTSPAPPDLEKARRDAREKLRRKGLLDS